MIQNRKIKSCRLLKKTERTKNNQIEKQRKQKFNSKVEKELGFRKEVP